MKFAVGIATAGRRTLMPQTMAAVARLNPRAHRVLVAPASPEDFDLNEALPNGLAVEIVQPARKGLTSQRNAILDALEVGDADVLVFFDDDYFPCADYLMRLQAVFESFPDTVALTGRPAVDGVNGPGVDVKEGLAIRDRAEAERASDRIVKETYGTYGCNMAFWLAPVQAHRLRFDERLPLYGWLEDIDFSRRVSAFGRIRESSDLLGVHLGTKSGRVSGVRFGYSQIANPVYCWRKGSMSAAYAGRQMLRNVAANVGRQLSPEAWIDRRGRLKGNWLAILDLMFGRSAPERILEL